MAFSSLFRPIYCKNSFGSFLTIFCFIPIAFRRGSVFSDHFRDNSGIFWETVSPKPKIFREFLGFWVDLFELKFLVFLLFRIFSKISGNFGGFLNAGGFLVKLPGISAGFKVRRGILLKILGNWVAFVFSGISIFFLIIWL